MPGKHVQAPEEARIKRAYLKGITHREIAEKFGRDPTTILSLIENGNWEPQRRAMRERILEEASVTTEEEVAKDLDRIRRVEERVWERILAADLSKEPFEKLLGQAREVMALRHRLIGVGQGNMPGIQIEAGSNVIIQQAVGKLPDNELESEEKRMLKKLGHPDHQGEPNTEEAAE